MKHASLTALFACASVSGCVTPPQYDDQTDKLISQLQTDVDTEFVSLETLSQKIAGLTKSTDAASQQAMATAKTKMGYDANSSFYDKIAVDLNGLQVRVDAEPSPATPHLDLGIGAIRENLLTGDGSMQQTHQQQNTLSLTYLRLTQSTIDSEIGALLARELGLKNGTSSSSTSSQASSSSAGKSATSTTSK